MKIINSLLAGVLFLTILPVEVRADLVDCDDFNYQDEAQNYLRAYPNDRNVLDWDNNGIACEHLESRNYGVLNKLIWQDLLRENIARKEQTKNKHSLTFYEANVIIGFEPYSKRGKMIWEDAVNERKIEAHIFYGEITNVKGMGF